MHGHLNIKFKITPFCFESELVSLVQQFLRVLRANVLP